MIRALTGIQIGPRQLELPPNIPLSDSAGSKTPVFLVSRVEHKGTLSMAEAEGTDAIGAQELLLVEHPCQHTAKLVFVQNRGESAASITKLTGSWMKALSSGEP